jgi:predicted dienelactone hydrolase
MRLSLSSLAAVALMALAALSAAPAQAGVGFQHLIIPDPQGPPLEVGVWYPTDGKPRSERIELDRQDVSPDAPIRGDHLALVLISHGHGGSYAGHADTAMALAEAGFVAAAVTHTGDNWRDDSQATAVWERPRHLKVLADYMLASWADHARLDAGRVGAFGFSAGGFTVLAAAGAEPNFGVLVEHCREHPQFEDCQIAAQQKPDLTRKLAWTHDGRIRAVVSAAPALGFAFGRDGLAAVRQPVQLWRAADDQVLPHPLYAEAVRLNLPRPPEMHVVPKAGHYDFLRPCSVAMAREVPAICASAPGFDRAAFHRQFNRQVVAFFRRTLT